METEQSPAEKVVNKLGGLTATSRLIDVPITTIQGWKDRGTIPQKYWAKLLKATAATPTPLTVNELAGVDAQ